VAAEVLGALTTPRRRRGSMRAGGACPYFRGGDEVLVPRPAAATTAAAGATSERRRILDSLGHFLPLIRRKNRLHLGHRRGEILPARNDLRTDLGHDGLRVSRSLLRDFGPDLRTQRQRLRRERVGDRRQLRHLRVAEIE